MSQFSAEPISNKIIRKLKTWTARIQYSKYELPPITLEQFTGQPHRQQIADPILDDCCMPPYVDNIYGKHHDDFTALMNISLWKKPEIILELGTAHGNTVANLCRLLPDAKIYTVNAPVEEQSGNNVTYELTKTEIGRVYRKYGFDKQITQLFVNTLHLNLTDFFESPVLDLAIIDACHDTEYVINDFLKVRPFMRQSGIVLFHDTHPSMKGHLIGSYRACMMLRQKGYDIHHLAATWWGVWVNNEALRSN